MFKQQKHLPYRKMKTHHPNQAYLERIPIKIKDSSAVENFAPRKYWKSLLQGANGRFEQMKPDKIHLSASKQTKESFIQQQMYWYRYIDAQGVYEIVSTDAHLDGQCVDKGTIQLVIPTEPTEQVTNWPIM